MIACFCASGILLLTKTLHGFNLRLDNFRICVDNLDVFEVPLNATFVSKCVRFVLL